MLNKKAKIAVFVSGGGTNLQALIDAQKSGVITSGEIVLVVASNREAYAIERAKNAGIEAVPVVKKDCADQIDFENKVIALLEEKNIDLIVLAGFMTILTEHFTSK